jgi:hypothetical protein
MGSWNPKSEHPVSQPEKSRVKAAQIVPSAGAPGGTQLAYGLVGLAILPSSPVPRSRESEDAMTRMRNARRTRISAIVAAALAAVLIAGSFGATVVLARVYAPPAVRVSFLLDDGRRETSPRIFLAVRFWGVCVRLEWLGAPPQDEPLSHR